MPGDSSVPLVARHPLGSGVLAAAALILLARVTAERLPVGVPIACVLLAGAVLSLAAARRLSDDRRLAWIVGGAYVLRAGLAIVLHVASASRLPVFTSLQLGAGFWGFAPDALTNHTVALALREDAARGGWLHFNTPLNLFCGTVALLYEALVPHPLIPILLGVCAATATSLLAWVIVRQVDPSPTRALTAAAVTAFWPSSLVWASQLMREGQFLFLLFLAYALMAMLIARRRGWAATAAALLGLGLVVVLLSMSRFHVGWVLLASTVVAALLGLATPSSHGRRAVAVCVLVIAVAVWIGTTQAFALPVSGRELAALAWRPVLIRLALPLAGLALAVVVALLALRGGPATVSVLAIVVVAALGTGAWLATTGDSLRQLLPRRFEVNPYQPGLGLRAAPGVWAFPRFDQLETFRQELAVRGGTMTELARTPIATPYTVVERLPRALVTALFVPFPWRWSARGETGAFRTFAGAEVLLIALVLPAVVAGGVGVLRRRSIIGYVMVTGGGLILLALALVVANEGTLFRYRLQGLLPLLVIGSAGGGFEIYPRAWRSLRRNRSQC